MGTTVFALSGTVTAGTSGMDLLGKWSDRSPGSRFLIHPESYSTVLPERGARREVQYLATVIPSLEYDTSLVVKSLCSWTSYPTCWNVHRGLASVAEIGRAHV